MRERAVRRVPCWKVTGRALLGGIILTVLTACYAANPPAKSTQAAQASPSSGSTIATNHPTASRTGRTIDAGPSPMATRTATAVHPPSATLAPGNLDNPRGIAFGRNGDIYIADSGSASKPYSGRIIRITPDGTVVPLIKDIGNLTGSLYGQKYFFGLSDVAVREDAVYGVFGLGAWLLSPRTPPHRLVKHNSVGPPTTVFDFAGFEEDYDPDGGGEDTNATGVAVANDGTLWVSDAAGNWVAHLAADGSVMVSVAFPPVNGEQAVPIGIAVGPDGHAYVTLFRCQVPTAGKGGVARVKPDGTYEIAVSGLSNPIDVTFDAAGTLYVLEYAVDYTPRSGRVLRVADGGATEVVVDDLNNPTSIALDSAGRIYVTEMASSAGGEPGTGRLIRFDLAGR